jgi:hypothetical protein
MESAPVQAPSPQSPQQQSGVTTNPGTNDTKKPPEMSQEEFDKLLRSRKHKIKVYDQEEELDYDTLKKRAQLEAASRKQIENASKSLKDYQKFIDNLKSRPDSLVELAKQLGHDFDSLAESHLIKKMNYNSMSEADKRLLRVEQMLEDIATPKQAKMPQEERNENLEGEAIQHAHAVENDLVSFFEQSKVKADPVTVAMMLMQMQTALQKNQEISAKEAYNRVKNSAASYRKSWFKDLVKSNSFDEVDPDFLKWVREQDMKRVRGKLGPKSVTPKQSTVTRRPANSKSVNDIFTKLDKKYGR